MKRLIRRLLIISTLVVAPTAHAQISADFVVLLKMYATSITQLAQMVLMVDQLRNQVAIMKELQQGITEALKIQEKLEPHAKGDLFEKWRTTGDALSKINEIYGRLSADPRSPKRLSDADRSTAESLAFRSHSLETSDEIDKLGKRLRDTSANASQKGAARLTAQGIGTLVQATSESIRAQNESLKLQATSILKSNADDKARSNHLLEVSDEMRQLMKSSPTKFARPRM